MLISSSSSSSSLLFHRFLLFVGAGFFVATTAAEETAGGVHKFPMYVGRSVNGIWKHELQYEILYYSTIKFVEGGSNQVDCVLNKLANGIFLPAADPDADTESIDVMTPDQAQQVEADFAAANPDSLDDNDPWWGGWGMSVSGAPSSSSSGMLTPSSSNNNDDDANNTSSSMSEPEPVAPTLVSAAPPGTSSNSSVTATAQSRRGGHHMHSKEEQTIQELYHQQSNTDMGERGGLEYEMEINLAVYINGEYLNRFQDITAILEAEAAAADDEVEPQMDTDMDGLVKELDDFVMEQAKTMVQPELIAEVPDDDFVVTSPFFMQELLDLRMSLDHGIYSECVWEFQGAMAGDNPSLINTTIIGRTIRGDYEGQPYEYSVFFEFYKLKGLQNEQQKQCFVDAIDDMFLTEDEEGQPTMITPMTTAQKDFARDVIQNEHDLQKSRFTMNSTAWNQYYTGSIYWEQSGAQVKMDMFGLTMAYQRGSILSLNGEYIRSYDDYTQATGGGDPLSLQSWINNMEDPIEDADDLKHHFPVNGTSQLREFFAPMASRPMAMVSFKPRKDGTGIFPIIFIENLIYCVNASALENYENPWGGMMEEDQEEEQEQQEVGDEDPSELLDTIFVGDMDPNNDGPAPDTSSQPAAEELAASSTSSAAAGGIVFVNNGGSPTTAFGILSIVLLALLPL